MGDTIKAVASPVADLLSPIFGGNGDKAAGLVNKVNPMVAQVQGQQLAQANNFNANMGNYEKDQINSATDANRLKTAQDQQAGTANSNARGMLYGGHNENQNNEIAANNTNALNSRIANINMNAQNTGQQLNNQAVNSGLVLQGLNQNVANQQYNAAMNQQQQNAQGFNSLVSGVGGLIGGGG